MAGGYRPRNRIWEPATVPSGAAVVDVPTLRDHLNITATDDDLLLAGLERAAVQMVERETQRLLVQRSCVLRLPSLPAASCPVELPGGVVASVSSVVVDGVAVTGCTAVGNAPALLVPSTDWPSVSDAAYPVVITYVAGFSAVPDDLVVAVTMIAAELYERRGAGSAEAVSVVPFGADRLMRAHRIWAI